MIFMFYDEEEFPKKYGDFLVVRFLLSSKIRPKLLLLLSKSNYNLNGFRRDLNKPSASILHGLKELESANLIKKTFKTYSLTSKGVLCSVSLQKLFEDLYIFQLNREFWLNHSIESIPQECFKNAYLLFENIDRKKQVTHNITLSITIFIAISYTIVTLNYIMPLSCCQAISDHFC